MVMLRDLMIDRDVFENIRIEALKSGDNSSGDIELLEKAVFQKLKKKRSVKKYKKMGVTKSDLKEIIELADIVDLDVMGGPSNLEMSEDHMEWCTGCGRCCTDSESIFVHRDEVNVLLTFNPKLKDEIVPNKQYPGHFEFAENRPCKFIDPETKRCRIYDSRPQICRSYPLALIESGGKAHHIIHLQYLCNYAVMLVLEKSMILFDEALKRAEKG